MKTKIENKQMHFFEINDPYLAVIAAKDEKRCLEIYTEVVSDVENEEVFYTEMQSIDKYTALKLVAESYIEDGGKVGIEEAFNQLENLSQDGELLIIAGSLL
ncbi:hypothetical protein [Enterococcus faecalis]|uniref:Uncharacterized protein n=1 Tax=Enterococcus faecalis RP2S-4 TaxID=1244145 RepID=A0ABC9TLF8_ENTFL|nr:hypothetical protein [Enterococcus faecalis]EPI08713.1 hypothetical protein D358_01488 [Enterococcus faecalis RP2S-4]